MTKPLDTFYKDGRNADGHRGRCKACYREAALLRYHDPASGRKEYERQWQRANADKLRVNQARHRAKHPERGKAASLRWRQKNYERWLATQRAWQAANLHRFRDKNNQRRARTQSKMLTGHTRAYMTSVYKALELEPCFYCGSCDRITVDHVIPLVRGGLHHPDNLVAACVSCNSSKGKRLLHEWPQWSASPSLVK